MKTLMTIFDDVLIEILWHKTLFKYKAPIIYHLPFFTDKSIMYVMRKTD